MNMKRRINPIFHSSYVMKLKVSAVALLLTVAGGTVQAEIYKWTDKQGVQHYSEQPPASSNYEKVKPSYAPAVVPPAAQPKDQSQGDPKKTDPDRAQQEQKYKEEAARVRQQNCETVQQRLADLESSPRITIKDTDGTLKRLSDDEREAKITDAQELIKKYCD